LRYIDLLLCNDHKTNNETTAIAMQQLHKYASVLDPLIGSGLCATMDILLEAVVSMGLL
jgi:7,8-dihydro-6-hydroxymethylpterin-pyrophosphokinase